MKHTLFSLFFLLGACGSTVEAPSAVTPAGAATTLAPWALTASNPRLIGASWSYTTPQGTAATYTASPDAYGATTLCLVDVSLTDTSGAAATTNGYTLAKDDVVIDVVDVGVLAAREHVADTFDAGETSTGVVVFAVPTSMTGLCASGSSITTSAAGSLTFVTVIVK